MQIIQKRTIDLIPKSCALGLKVRTGSDSDWVLLMCSMFLCGEKISGTLLAEARALARAYHSALDTMPSLTRRLLQISGTRLFHETKLTKLLRHVKIWFLRFSRLPGEIAACRIFPYAAK